MELGLSLGEKASKQSFGFTEQARVIGNKGSLGLFMGLSVANNPTSRNHKRKQQQESVANNPTSRNHKRKQQEEDDDDDDDDDDDEDDDDEDVEEEDQESRIKEETIEKIFLDFHQQKNNIFSKDSTLIQLNLLPNTPVNPRHNHLALLSAPHNDSTRASSFDLDFGIYSKSGGRASSRASDEDSSRKKLRLSKQQSAFLEDSFKQHSTLNPKHKLALAKQLNLLPRQVEVWFQNRRARTKLKQTGLEFEYLKICCERLTQENTRLRKELQQLRALKSSIPFNIHLPPTTLTTCPSCERVATTSTSAPTANPTTTNNSTQPTTTSKSVDFDLPLTSKLLS